MPTPTTVDGAWWPRSTDLSAELPGLLEAVRDRTGDVALVGFHRDGWDPPAEPLRVAGRTLWLKSVSDDEPHNVIVIGSSGRCLTLAVVQPDTLPAEAVAQLAAPAHLRQAIRAQSDPADVRWLSELVIRLAATEDTSDERRVRTIRGWAEDAAGQFVDAPVQAYVPVLVEHIVREQMAHGRPDAGPEV